MRLIIVIALLAYIASIQPDGKPGECFTDTCVGCTDDCLTSVDDNPRANPKEI